MSNSLDELYEFLNRAVSGHTPLPDFKASGHLLKRVIDALNDGVKYKKALDLLYKKEVNIEWLKAARTYKNYNTCVRLTFGGTQSHYDEPRYLTEDGFKQLKEVFSLCK